MRVTNRGSSKKWRVYLLFTVVLLLFGNLLLNTEIKQTRAKENDSYLFESDFENDILTEFDGTEKVGTNAALERVLSPIYRGSYALRGQGGDSGWQRAITYKTFPGAQRVYVRVFVYFPKLWTYQEYGKENFWIYFITLSYGHPPAKGPRGQYIYWAGFRVMYFRQSKDTPAGFYWTGYYYSSSEGGQKYFPEPDSSIPTVTPGRWYCVEIMLKRESSPGAADGEFRIWIDEDEIYTDPRYEALRRIRNNDNYSGPVIDTINLGMFETPPPDSGTEPPRVVILDSLKVSDAYIGPEPGTQPDVTIVFNAGTWNGVTYHVALTSNSSIRGFSFNQSMMRINFNVTGISGIIGHCNITIPNDLLGGPYTVLMDDLPITTIKTSNSTHAFIHFSYIHSSHRVTIIGTTVVCGDITRPRANAGPDQMVNEDTSVKFDGSASWDNIGIVSYTWTFMDVTPQTLTGINPTYIFATPGNYTVTLNVTDAAGNRATGTIVIRVLDVTNPIADAGGDQTVKAGRAVLFDASKSTDNVGIVSYEWDFGDGTKIAGSWWVKARRTYAKPGTYAVKLTVKDAAGNTGTDSITIVVEEAPIEKAPVEFPWWILRDYWWVIVAGILVAAELIVHRQSTYMFET